MESKKLIFKNSKNSLQKAKKLLKTVTSILEKGLNCKKFKFRLPRKLTRTQQRAVDSRESVVLLYYNIMLKENTLICLIKRIQAGKNYLVVVPSNLVKFIIDQKIGNENYNICIFNDIGKFNLESYDEILILGEYNLDMLLFIKEKNQRLSFATSKQDYIQYFPNHKVFELVELRPPAFEILNFARRFLPSDSKFNNQNFLERQKINNSGGNKPFFYEVDSFERDIEVLKDIFEDICPTDNIGILLPYGNDKDNFDLSVEKYHQVIKKEYGCSKYYEGIKLKKLCNIVITTFEEIRYLDFDIVIILNFNIIKKIVDNQVLFAALCSARNQLHLVSKR